MGETDLPSWAPVGEQPTGDGSLPPSQSEPRRSGGTGLLVLLALLLLGVVGLGAMLLLAGDGTTDASATEPQSGSEVAAQAVVSEPTVTTAAPEAAAADQGGSGEAVESGEAASTEADGASAADQPLPDNSEGQIRQSRLSGGKVYLEGTVPNQEMKDLIYQATVAETPAELVVNDLQIDPASPAEVEGYPIVIDDVVLFDSGSSMVLPESEQVLQGLALWLAGAPEYSMTIVSHTDARGAAESNLALAGDRALSVQEFMVRNGVDPGQLQLRPLGEQGQEDGQSAEEAAAARRVEFVLDLPDQ